MALKILRYRLYLIDPHAAPAGRLLEGDLLHPDVVLMPGDRMRAERESTKLLAPSQRDRKANAETWMMLWLWCAATRLGVFTGTLEDFAGVLVDYDELDAAGAVIDKTTPKDERDDERTDVDPTAADPLTT